AHGTADRSGGSGLADRHRERAVGGRLAATEPLELAPDRRLARSADEPHRHVELGAGAGEVLDELLTGGVEHGVRALGLPVVGESTLVLDVECGDGDVVAEEFESPDGAVEAGEEHAGHGSSVAAASDID